MLLPCWMSFQICMHIWEKKGEKCTKYLPENTNSFTHVQARSQGGFEGVRTNPPCSLAKFIFNATAAVQGTIIQPCSYRRQTYIVSFPDNFSPQKNGLGTRLRQTSHHAAATRGSHMHVACRSVCYWNQEFWWWKSSLIAWLYYESADYEVIIDHTPHE